MADTGHPFAAHYLGVLHLSGLEGVALDRGLARHYLHLSLQHPAAVSSPLSAFFLASLHQKGEGGPVSLPTALSLYRFYVARSSPGDEFHTEALFRAGSIATQDRARDDPQWVAGWAEIEAAAHAGHAEAMLVVAREALGAAQREGRTDREEEARAWLTKAQTALRLQLEHEHGKDGAHRLLNTAGDPDDDGDDDSIDSHAQVTVSSGGKAPMHDGRVGVGNTAAARPKRAKGYKRGRRR